MSSRLEYAFYKSLKICPVCRHERAAPNRVRCLNCLDEAKIYNAKYKANLPPQVREKNYQSSKESTKKLCDYRKKNGLCIACGKIARKGKTKCVECALKDNKRNKALRERNKRINEKPINCCALCNNVVFNGTKVCKKHYNHLNNIRPLSSGKDIIKKSISDVYKLKAYKSNKSKDNTEINQSYKRIGVL